jgi:hypothetical protein
VTAVADEAGLRRLDEHRGGTSPQEALAFFDSLPPVPVEDVVGRWKGSELPTGSPLDGLLAAYGWWGKEMLDAESVHPLLFSGPHGPYPVNPSLVPMALLRSRPQLASAGPLRRAATLLLPLARTGRPAARLREVEHRGTVSAAMLYDALPIVDHFRRVADDVVLGLMDMRALPEPFFFVLRRDVLR